MIQWLTMETKVLNYRIIIKPVKEGHKIIYTAACSTLGVYDWGDTVEEVLKSIQEGIECHVETLLEEGGEIPVDYPEKELVTETKITVPANASLTSA